MKQAENESPAVSKAMRRFWMKRADVLQAENDTQRSVMQGGLVEALKNIAYEAHHVAANNGWNQGHAANLARTIEAQANAAISAVEKLTQTQETLVLDLDKAERIGEQLLRDSPIVNGPAVEGRE